MNELQLGMLGLGVAAVAGVVFFNKWQERKQRQVAERVLERGHADVLLDAAPATTAGSASAVPGFAADMDAFAPKDDATIDSFSAIDDVDPADSGLSFGANDAPAAAATAAAVVLPAALTATDGRIEPKLGTADVAATGATLSNAALIAERGAEHPAAAGLAGRQGDPAALASAPPSAPASAPQFATANPPATLAVAGAAKDRSAAPVVAARDNAAPAPAPVPAAPSPASLAARETASAQLLLSPLVDYIAVIDAADPASASQLLRSQRAALARLRKPVRWLGCNERTREWEPLREDSVAEYRRLRVGLQLVDRRGPVNEVELAIFQRAMQDLADELIAVIDLAPAQPALEAAASLDGFCADVDIQIGINVISQGLPFPGSKLRALAEAAGMLLDGEGRFVRRDDDGQALFVLSNQESGGFPGEELKTLTTHGVTFLLDVPRVAHGDRVFAQMLELARRFAATLHGALVDDNRRPLAEGALEPIRRAIAQSQAAMAARQVPAGSALAQRLFA
ncbi:cell division protein ZipA C-terminal FtsZ-binding domain-containing protein [Rhodocyclus tenuis]|uniref:Cell division protein ZipA n=2 Tax=Rhodocyclus tenuis TaxID=1066 RepID=A0A840FY54_RHOTE|nr:cell division protein ZipA C-terminal FtsZ-binding domain-containing protein [Rhodocyclus tenuis]MBB4247057.1 hypothetical protein [Rhodocyclus tenuis]